MKTKHISLYYGISRDKVFPLAKEKLELKDKWLQQNQAILKQGEEKTIKVTYEIESPEAQKQKKFFEGPVVDYWTIQNQELYGEDWGERLKEIRKIARRTVLDEVLGYDVELLNGGKTRDRTSTTDYKDQQEWHDFLKRVEEMIFEPHGYEYPKSETFWELAKKYNSYEKARKISIEQMISHQKTKLGL